MKCSRTTHSPPSAQRTVVTDGVTQCAKALALTLALWASDVSAINFAEGTSKLQKADEIDRTYVVPLALKSKPAEQAMTRLLAEGFRCKLEPFSSTGLDMRPYADCVKQPSGFGELCDDLIVTLRFQRLDDVRTRADVVRHLDKMKIASALPFCPYKRKASAEYLATRGVGEQSLAQYADGLDLVGNAKKTYDTLLIEGFYCGFAADPIADSTANAPTLVCTKVPSKIKYCFEAKLVIDVDWPAGQTATSQLHGAMSAAQVKTVRSSCEVPVVKSQGERM
jgi:hypothetical protein